MANITAIAAGWGHSVALNEQDEVFVWGAKPSTYELDYSGKSTKFYDRITKKEGLKPISKIACGSWHVMAIDFEGKVWSWGWNDYGMLGNGTKSHSDKPVCMDMSTSACSIGGGCFQSLIIDSSGSIYSCGDNNFGQLGLANQARQTRPQKMILDIYGNQSTNKIASPLNLTNVFFGLVIVLALILYFVVRDYRKVRS